MEQGCVFCTGSDFILENHLAYLKYDKHPVNKGHLLIIPKRHYSDFFQSTKEEIEALLDLLFKAKVYLDNIYKPDGYNIGLNCGTAAGQTIMHLHIHLIPRYQGDTKNPIGGVRGAIPGKMKYP